jgi:hypothetical protein
MTSKSDREVRVADCIGADRTFDAAIDALIA